MTGAAVVCGLLVGLGALVVWPSPPARRRTAGATPRPTRLDRSMAFGGSSSDRRGGRDERVEPIRRTGLGRGARSDRRAGPDLGAAATEVAARLRAGEDPRRAWDRALARSGRGRRRAEAQRADLVAPEPEDLLARLDVLLLQRSRPQRRVGELEAQLAAVRAAVGLAARVGAPLADVLDRCAAGITEAGRAEAARRIALAGPASTARVLGWLPAAGVALAWAVGLEPVAVLLDGGIGTAVGLVGLGLVVLGRRWSAVLVDAARSRGR